MRSITLLVADDETDVRRLIAGWLRADGYDVLEAATGDEALAQAAAAPRLLVADLVLPPAGGLELVDRIRCRVPGLAVLFISGYAPDPFLNGDPDAPLLSKPFTRGQLRAQVERLLGAS
jgi:CheY-like chemotaxis protein